MKKNVSQKLNQCKDEKSLVFLNDKCSGSKILKDDIGVKCAGDFGISPWDVDK